MNKESKYYALEEKEINALLQFLSSKPYIEVFQLIQLLQKARVVTIENTQGGEENGMQEKKEEEKKG